MTEEEKSQRLQAANHPLTNISSFQEPSFLQRGDIYTQSIEDVMRRMESLKTKIKEVPLYPEQNVRNNRNDEILYDRLTRTNQGVEDIIQTIYEKHGLVKPEEQTHYDQSKQSALIEAVGSLAKVTSSKNPELRQIEIDSYFSLAGDKDRREQMIRSVMQDFVSTSADLKTPVVHGLPESK